ncbi:MAG: hemolysin family protein [Acidimicrobiia bacterium]
MVSPVLLGGVAFFALLMVAAVLAVAETSLTHLGRARAVALQDAGQKRAPALLNLLDRRERVLNPILFVLLTCHLAAATIVAVVSWDRWGAGGVLVAFVVELVLLFVLAEAVPKTYALLAADRAALAITPLARAIAAVAPLRWVTRLLVGTANVILPGRGRHEGMSVSEEELLALAGVAVDDATIDADERQLIENTIEFGDTIVREVMVPRPDMITVPADFRVGDVMEVAILNGYSRVPVSGEGIDDIVGVAYAKDLMRAERDHKADDPVRAVMREARFVPETKKLASLLREMQAQRNHLAVVVDEYGGTAGLVTMEDLLEELVGEIVDEYDEEEGAIEELASGDVRVTARMNIDDLNERLGLSLPEGDWDSIGGLLIGILGHVPVAGETAEVDGHRLQAETMQGRRIDRVLITRAPPTPGAPG